MIDNTPENRELKPAATEQLSSNSLTRNPFTAGGTEHTITLDSNRTFTLDKFCTGAIALDFPCELSIIKKGKNRTTFSVDAREELVEYSTSGTFAVPVNSKRDSYYRIVGVSTGPLDLSVNGGVPLGASSSTAAGVVRLADSAAMFDYRLDLTSFIGLSEAVTTLPAVTSIASSFSSAKIIRNLSLSGGITWAELRRKRAFNKTVIKVWIY